MKFCIYSFPVRESVSYLRLETSRVSGTEPLLIIDLQARSLGTKVE
jgi:hypothetical protein